MSLPKPVAARFKAWFCGHSLAGIAGSNPTVSCECVMTGGGNCDGLITSPEASYRVHVCP